MKALFILGIFLMFGGIVMAAATPLPSTSATTQDNTTSKVVTYSVFGGFVLVLISWVSSLKK